MAAQNTSVNAIFSLSVITERCSRCLNWCLFSQGFQSLCYTCDKMKLGGTTHDGLQEIV